MTDLGHSAATTLPTLYTTCVQGFNHVQVARSFGTDFARAQLRLDLVQLRFSRWAKSTMIDNSYHESCHGAVVSSTNKEDLAKSLLGQISTALEDAKKTAKCYQLPEAAQQQQHLELDVGDTLPSFHRQVRTIAQERQKGTNLAKKFMWAISDNDRFNHLVDQVGRLVDELIRRFPEAHDQQDHFVTQEVEEILPLAESGETELLRDTANNVDTTFAATVERHIERGTGGHSYQHVRVGHTATVQVGNMYLTGSRPTQQSTTGHSYRNIQFSGNARGVLGDQFGGKGLFD